MLRTRILLPLASFTALGLAALREPGAAGPRALGPAVAQRDAAPAEADEQARADAAARYFHSDVRPVLELRCFRCHGPDAERQRGGLRLGSRADVLAGGVSGPAAVPGDPDASLLVQAVRYTDLDLAMPPAEKLPEPEIEVLERWVAEGLVWPADATEPTASRTLVPVVVEVPDTAPAFEPEALAFFENEIRPLLVENCFACHGPDVEHPKSGLRMSGWRSMIAGGARGAAVVPGDVAASLLAHAIGYADSDLRMPPTGKLAADQIAKLEHWIAIGAPWTPGSEDDARAHGPAAGVDYAAGREWWAFRPVAEPPVPEVPAARAAEVRDPLDAFVLAELEQRGLEPNPRAPERELVRRAFVALIGLPPTLAEIDAYLADEHPDKWSRLVDALLARPAYGERWARHWLDLVLYAETNGYERDTPKPYAWRYRDWVVDAFNSDLAYDRFLAAQLAGDALAADDPAEAAANRVATGLYRLAPWDDEPADKEQALYDGYDDIVRTISEGMLGVTLACARCHDHKFDPFAQEDYYSLLAFVRGVQPFQLATFRLDSAVLQPLTRTPAALERWEADRADAIAGLQSTLQAMLEPGRERVRVARRAALEPGERTELDAWLALEPSERPPAARQRIAQLETVRDNEAFGALQVGEAADAKAVRIEAAMLTESFEGNLDWALVATEAGPELPETRVLIRGQATSPGPLAAPRFPPALCPSDDAAAPPAHELRLDDADLANAPSPAAEQVALDSAKARLALARWVASPENPLTARVLVNRVWQHHFGRGLVPTPNDFGRAGQPPSHPELLDHLAARFVAGGWSVKDLQRWILNSSTWQRDSRVLDARAHAADPGNELLWRQNPRRLEAEAVRDAMLAASGALRLEPRGGPSYFPQLSRDALAGASRPGFGWGKSAESERARRSLYAFVKRTLILPFFATFDYTTTSLPVGLRQPTNLASQSMALLNGAFANRQAAHFAESLVRAIPDDGDTPADAARVRAARIELAFERALARRPSATELALADEYVAAVADELAQRFASGPAELALVPLVPLRLDEGFLPLLEAADLLYGPREGWSYAVGRWGEPYNSTLEADADCGPIAVLSDLSLGRFDPFAAAPSEPTRFEAQLGWGEGCRRAGFVLALEVRADGTWHGIEVALEPAHERVRVLARSPAAAWQHDVEELRELARVPARFGASPVRPELEGCALAIECDATGLRVFLDGAVAAEVPAQALRLAPATPNESEPGPASGSNPAAPPPAPAIGHFGLRTVGDALHVVDARLSVPGNASTGDRTAATSVVLRPDDPGPPERVALESFCLTLFAHNEFLHVD